MRLLSHLFLTLALATACEEQSMTEIDPDGDGLRGPSDCMPDNPYVYDGAPDARGDGCDADCGVQDDADGDDWPDDADCAPEDATIYPCAPEADNDGIDSDCGGEDGPRPNACDQTDPTTQEETVILNADCSVP